VGWSAVIPVADDVSVDITVPFVSDAVAIQIAVGTVALPALPTMVPTLVVAPVVNGCRPVNRAWLRKHRHSLYVKALNLHADGKSHIAVCAVEAALREPSAITIVASALGLSPDGGIS